MAYVMDAKWTGIAKRGYFDGLCNRPGQVGIAKKGNLMTYVIDSEWWDFPKREFDGLCNGFGWVENAKKGNLMAYIMDLGGWGLPKKEI
jgi:hypothetical protein